MKFISTITAAIIALLGVAFSDLEATAASWRTVDEMETFLRVEGWPEDLPCRFRDGGYNSNFAVKRLTAYCPAAPARYSYRTFIRILELQSGYHWQGGHGEDIRSFKMFSQTKGYFEYFNKAEFDPDQKFYCYSSRECQFRRITFSVEGQPCQWVFHNPSLGNTDYHWGQGSIPFAVEILHCGATKPFMPDHIRLKPRSVVLTFPGFPETGRSPAGPPNRLVCARTLNAEHSAWHLPEFKTYVDIAERRGLTVENCIGLLESAMRVRPGENPATPEKGNKPRDAFTRCFDNPESCK